MGKKAKGHYRYGCGSNRPNEKFSGKGHRRHLCKECMKAARNNPIEEGPPEKHSERHYMKSLKNTMVLHTASTSFILFEYAGNMYIADPENSLSIFRHEASLEPPFQPALEFEDSTNIWDALLNKYDGKIGNGESIESGEYLDAYDGLNGTERSLTKKEQKFVEVVLALEEDAMRGLGL